MVPFSENLEIEYEAIGSGGRKPRLGFLVFTMDNLRPALVGAVAGVSAYFLCSALFDKNVSGDIDGSCAAGEVPDVLGFVGIGTINSAVIRGLCTAPNPPKRQIYIKPGESSTGAELMIFGYAHANLTVKNGIIECSKT